MRKENSKIKSNKKPQKQAKAGKGALEIRFLGGVGEIGKNMTALQYGDDIIIIDDGLTFPGTGMLGIDYIVPDTSFVVKNKEKVRGIFLTHGHEDHIGGLPYLLSDINAPVYGTALTLALAANKLGEHNIKSADLNVVEPGSRINAGRFCVEFIYVNHSIPDACALAISTPVGMIVHSGDFKIDLTPLSSDIIDITRFSEIGKSGVLLLLCESTNACRPGYSMSEHVVRDTLDKLFRENTKRRLIVATFATNVCRVQQIIDLAEKYKRKVALYGRSMINVVDTAKKIGKINIPDGIMVNIDKIDRYEDKNLVIISTGTQGEPMSALTRMASDDDLSKVDIGSNDTIIISASFIPGNEKSIYNVINNLYRKGAEVIYSEIDSIHASGHACQEELKILHSLLKPKFFIPIHGEFRHLKKHCALAKDLGMKEGNMLICDIGATVKLTSKSMKRAGRFKAGSKLVDGKIFVDTDTIAKRSNLATDGVVVVSCCISAENGSFAEEPVINAKGIVLSKRQIDACKNAVINIVEQSDVKETGDCTELNDFIVNALRKYLLKTSDHAPVIVPVITRI